MRRPPRLSPSGLEETPLPRPRRWPLLAGIAATGLLVLAWFDGGEEPVHPIAETVALPGQGQ